MTAQAAKVEKAIELMHSRYQKNRDKIRAFEEKQDGITITVTSSELNLLRLLVSDRVGHEHNVWYETTHDELLEKNGVYRDLYETQFRLVLDREAEKEK